MKIQGLTEKVVYLVSGAGVLATGFYLFFQKPNIKRADSKSDNIGYIQPLGPDVRVRGLEDTNWNSIRLDANVFQNDKVYTGNKSTAVVKLKSNQKLTIQPNSLVVIGDQNENVHVNLNSGGSFLGELKKGVKLFIKKDKTEFQVEGDGATVQINSQNDNEIKLVVLKGEASVKSAEDANPINVVAHSEVTIVDDQKIEIKPLFIELNFPEAASAIWNEDGPTKFKWATKGDEPDDVFTVEVSNDPLFPENSTLTKESKIHQADFKLTPGNVYFWRVKNKKTLKHNESLSATSSFSFFDLKPPIIQEISSLEIKTDWRGQTLTPVTFRWIDPSLSDRYEFQISDDSEFKKTIYTEKIDKTFLSVSRLSEGKHFWRVISYRSGRKDLISKTAQFTVNADKKEESTPLNNQRIIAQAPEEIKIEEPEIKPEVKTEEKPELVQNVEQSPPPLPVLETPKIKKETYFFELTFKGDENSKVTKGFIKVNDPELTWNSVDTAESYTVEVSPNKAFTQIIKSESVVDSKWIWRSAQIGQFFVRIKAQRTAIGGEKEESVSQISSLRTLLAAPKLISVGLEQNQPQNIQAEWISHNLSENSEIQIAKSLDFSSPEVLKTKDHSYVYVANEPGVFYVRVRSLNEKYWPISGFTAPQEITVPAWIAADNAPTLAEAEQNPKPDNGSYLHDPKISVEFGSGFNYSSFKQEDPQSSESGDFASIGAPSTALGLGIKLSDHSKITLEYENSPGKIKTTSQATVDKTQFNRKSFIADYQYAFSQNSHLRYSLLLGAQQHDLPFLSVNDNDEVSLLQNRFLNGSLGLKLEYLTDSNFEYTAQFRYQTLLSAKSLDGYNLNATSSLNYDSSLGVSKIFGNGFKAGFYWLGQQQSFKYNFSRDGKSSTGSQSFFDSNIQLRFGWDFYGLLTLSTTPFLFRWRRKRNLEINLMKNNLFSKASIFVIWVLTFTFAIVILSKNGVLFKSHLKTQSQAAVLKEMSENWLSQAQMRKRIFVKEVVLQKSSNKLSSVEISLATSETFNQAYQNQLIQFLNKKAQTETGLPYFFRLSVLQ